MKWSTVWKLSVALFIGLQTNISILAASTTLAGDDFSATQFLIPYVVAMKEGPPEDHRPHRVRSGWSTSLGLYNPSSRGQRYRFTYLDSAGGLVARYRTHTIPPGQNLFTIPELMACGERRAAFPDEPCEPEATFILEEGSGTSLVERTYAGYVLVENAGSSEPFFVSAWVARGGVDLINPVTKGPSPSFVSFGYNRAAFRVPVYSLDRLRSAPARSLIFPALALQRPGRLLVGDPLDEAGIDLRDPFRAPNPEDPLDPGISGLPNGWDVALCLFNPGSRAVTVEMKFLPEGASRVVAASASLLLDAYQQKAVPVSAYLGPDLGRGSLMVDFPEGPSRVIGFAVQSDSLFQFLAHTVPGFSFLDSPETIGESGIYEYLIPLAVRSSERTGFDSVLGIFNPSPAEVRLRLDYFGSSGRILSTGQLSLSPQGSFTGSIALLEAPQDFLGYIKVTSSRPLLFTSTVGRGGFDTAPFGWQTFSFDVTVQELKRMRKSREIGVLAVNESLSFHDEPPLIAPLFPEDIVHVNGFDLALQLVNLDVRPLHLRVHFLRRYVRPQDRDDRITSQQLHLLPPNHSLLLIAGLEFNRLDPEDLRDGMLLVEILDAETGGPVAARVAACAVEGDRGFKWFGYSAPVHSLR